MACSQKFRKYIIDRARAPYSASAASRLLGVSLSALLWSCVFDGTGLNVGGLTTDLGTADTVTDIADACAGDGCDVPSCNPSSTQACLSFTPSNLQALFVPVEGLATGALNIPPASRYTLDTNAMQFSNTDTGAPPTPEVFAGHLRLLGSEYGLMVVTSATIGAAATFRVTGSRPLILVSLGRVSVDGSIAINAKANVPGAGGGRGGSVGAPGDGCGGGLAGVVFASPAPGEKRGSGGGGASFGGLGGKGGRPQGGDPVRAECGDPCEGALIGGSGGGGGVHVGGLGGAGGGAIQLVSGVEISFGPASLLHAGGGGGLRGGVVGDPGTGAGGGSGGAILFEAPAVSMLGILAANGGGGGGAGALGDPGESGDDARVDLMRAAGGRGGVVFQGDDPGAGGAGSGDMSRDGLDGEFRVNLGGGGGGASGHICIRTRGSLGGGGVFSPDPRMDPLPSIE